MSLRDLFAGICKLGLFTFSFLALTSLIFRGMDATGESIIKHGTFFVRVIAACTKACITAIQHVYHTHY